LPAWARSDSQAFSTPDATPGITLPMKFKPWRSALLRNSVRPLWSFQEEKAADKRTLRGHSIGGDDDVIE
jgi:hypothetical protein